MVCVHIHVCVRVYRNACVLRLEVNIRCLLSITPHLIFLCVVSASGPETHSFNWTGWSESPRNPPASTFPALGLQTVPAIAAPLLQSLCTDAGDPSSTPCATVASACPLSSFPSPWITFLCDTNCIINCNRSWNQSAKCLAQRT